MKLLFAFLFLLTATFSFGQDTLVFCQTNSPWVSNCYYFFYKSKVKGGFEKIWDSDDGQYWSGKGTFIETKKKIMTSLTILSLTMQKINYDSLIHDTTVIKTRILNPSVFYKQEEQLILGRGRNKVTFSKQKRSY